MIETPDERRQRLKESYPRYRHWEIFLTIERDLEDLSRYITIHRDNFSSYSIEISALIMRCCSETEKLCKRITGAPPRCEFKDFVLPLVPEYPEFSDFEINFLLWELSFKPWFKTKTRNPVPVWWTQYNKIKHDEKDAEKAGNIEVCLNAVSGLYIATLYYERFLYANPPQDGSESVVIPHALEPQLVTPYRDFSVDHRTLWGNQFAYTWQETYAQTTP